MHAIRTNRANLPKVWLVAIGLVVGLAAVVVLSQQRPSEAQETPTGVFYTATDIGSLMGGPFNTYAYDINDAGQVVGYSSTDDGYHAFLYDEKATPKMKDLSALGDNDSYAYAINDVGQVVGHSMNHAFLYDASATPQMQDLGTFGGEYSVAMDVNDAGQVVGYYGVLGSGEQRAFLYDASATPKMHDLGTLTLDGYPSEGTIATGINDAGQVVGFSGPGGGLLHAFLYDASASPKMTDLGTLGGGQSMAEDINEAGQVVGTSEISGGVWRAFLYNEDATPKMTNLGALGGDSSFAAGINESGQVVGSSSTSSGVQHAFLYSDSQMVDLNSLVPPDSGWNIRSATAINRSGQIVGSGDRDHLVDRPLLLTSPKKYSFAGFFRPVDNPPTMNAVKAGSAVPVKFSLGGDEGLNVFAEGYPKSRRVSCSSSAPLDTIEQTTSAAGGSTLSYDATTKRYTYAWKTQKAWSGTCRQFIVQLDDGSVHRANFKFK